MAPYVIVLSSCTTSKLICIFYQILVLRWKISSEISILILFFFYFLMPNTSSLIPIDVTIKSHFSQVIQQQTRKQKKQLKKTQTQPLQFLFKQIFSTLIARIEFPLICNFVWMFFLKLAILHPERNELMQAGMKTKWYAISKTAAGWKSERQGHLRCRRCIRRFAFRALPLSLSAPAGFRSHWTYEWRIDFNCRLRACVCAF